MLTGHNEAHRTVGQNLPGLDAEYFGIQSVVRIRPGCFLHQCAFLLKDAPARAVPVQKTGIRLCKPLP